MLAMGRALMAKPKLLLLDEPSMGLAPLIVKTIFNIIEEINRDGTTILLVEQNANMALSIATRAYVIETGSVIFQELQRSCRQVKKSGKHILEAYKKERSNHHADCSFLN